MIPLDEIIIILLTIEVITVLIVKINGWFRLRQRGESFTTRGYLDCTLCNAVLTSNMIKKQHRGIFGFSNIKSVIERWLGNHSCVPAVFVVCPRKFSQRNEFFYPRLCHFAIWI